MLWGECISGALYVGDFKRLAAEAGFVDQRVLHAGEIAVQVPKPSTRREKRSPKPHRRLQGPIFPLV